MNRALFACILFLPFTAHAELTFEQLEAISSTPEKLEGRFKQEKYLSHIDVSLFSSGVFSYQRGQEIHWHTLKPIQNELIITPEVIINRQDGRDLVHVDVDSNPSIRLLSELFFSVLTAEWQKLGAFFEISGEKGAEQWTAELVPIDKVITQFSDRIILRGDTLLREIIIYEKSGNYTIIRFSELSQ